MADVPAQTVNPRGIFDRTTAGMKTRPVSYPVEKGRIAFFCDVVGEKNPIHFDEDAARTWDSMIGRMTDEQFDAMIDVHLKAPFRIRA